MDFLLDGLAGEDVDDSICVSVEGEEHCEESMI